MVGKKKMLNFASRKKETIILLTTTITVMENKKLFSDFAPVSKQEWIDKI